MIESEIYGWLKQSGFPTPEYKVFGDDEQADVDFFPVALKIQSPRVVHKSDVGGVITNIPDAAALTIARQQIVSNLQQHGISINSGDKFIASHMCKGIELFFGVVNDPVFERVIVFGAGGIYAELFKDICFIDSEAGYDEIVRAILQTKISVLFTKGFRGIKYDIQPVIELVQKLQKLQVQELDFNPVILQPSRLTIVDARLSQSSKVNLHKPVKHIPGFFKPANVAIIGASSQPGKVGYAVAKNTAAQPNVFLVNPAIDELFGKKVYHSIAALPPVDTAVLAIPAPAIAQAVEELGAKGVKNIIIITAGFKETGQDEGFLQQLANKYQLNILGPNCLGAYLNGINLTFAAGDVLPGPLNLFSQSGAILAELMDKAALKHYGFENAVSVGNMADIDFADLVNSYKGSNPINLYVEGVAHGKNLLRAIRSSSAPVRIYKAGQNEAAGKAAFSHTGNMAGNYPMFCGLVKGAGAQVLNNIDGLLYPFVLNKILVITNAGGVGTVMSDLLGDKLYQLTEEQKQQLSAVLPANWSNNNPVDIIGDAGPARFIKALQVADSFGADAIYVIITPQFMTDTTAICQALTSVQFKTTMLPVLLGGPAMQEGKSHLTEHNITFFEELHEAVSFL